MVSVQWLYKHLNDALIIEVNREPHMGYYQWHIPNSRFLHDDLVYELLRSGKSPREQYLKGLMDAVGDDTERTMVLYDEGDGRSATLTYLLLRSLGYRNVAILNGGKRAWLTQVGLQCTCGGKLHNEPTGTRAQPSPSIAINDIVSRDELLRAPPRVGETLTLIDARTPEEYETAHIPGAINIPWTVVYNDDGTFREPSEIRKVLSSHGVNEDSNIIIYCRTGHRSSVLWFTMKELLGMPNVKVYLGSWVEWSSNPESPVKTGPNP